MMDVKFTDNSDTFIDETQKAVDRVLVALGVHLEGEAKDELNNLPIRIDTGRLWGSIVYATDKERSKGTGATKKSKYPPHKKPPTDPKDWTPKAIPEKNTLYVGTNVEYAPYVHEGTSRMKPNRFLKNAFVRNEDQIKEYITKEIKDANMNLQKRK